MSLASRSCFVLYFLYFGVPAVPQNIQRSPAVIAVAKAVAVAAAAATRVSPTAAMAASAAAATAAVKNSNT